MLFNFESGILPRLFQSSPCWLFRWTRHFMSCLLYYSSLGMILHFLDPSRSIDLLATLLVLSVSLLPLHWSQQTKGYTTLLKLANVRAFHPTANSECRLVSIDYVQCIFEHIRSRVGPLLSEQCCLHVFYLRKDCPPVLLPQIFHLPHQVLALLWRYLYRLIKTPVFLAFLVILDRLLFSFESLQVVVSADLG